jgi:hypothetical protein
MQLSMRAVLHFLHTFDRERKEGKSQYLRNVECGNPVITRANYHYGPPPKRQYATLQAMKFLTNLWKA